MGVQNFFSSLTAEPTNWPPVWDYDPDTPLAFMVTPSKFLPHGTFIYSRVPPEMKFVHMYREIGLYI